LHSVVAHLGHFWWSSKASPGLFYLYFFNSTEYIKKEILVCSRLYILFLVLVFHYRHVVR
jgi:hypothetical protein